MHSRTKFNLLFLLFFLAVLRPAHAQSADDLLPACRQTGEETDAGIIKGNKFYSIQRMQKMYKKAVHGLSSRERRKMTQIFKKDSDPLYLVAARAGKRNLQTLQDACDQEPTAESGGSKSIEKDAFSSPISLECSRRNLKSCKSSKKTPTPVSNPTSPPPAFTATPKATIAPTQTHTPAPTPANTATPTPVPVTPPAELSRWQSHMLTYGAQHCATLKNQSASLDTRLGATYYDSQRVFFQIADYTGDAFWLSCAAAAEAVYRDQYVIANNGGVPGYWNFSEGIAEDFLRTGDSTSRQASKLLAENAAYARDTTPLSYTSHCDLSRETAYTIMAYLNAELVGEPRRSRLPLLVDQAFGHMDQWFVSKSAPYVRPFMVALTSEALIKYDAMVGDSDVLPIIELAANWLWDNTWLPSAEAFMYTDREHSTGGMGPAPDLNLLIAPVYAWLYHQTGNPVHLDRADRIFNGGVKQAYLSNGKQFNQSYRWSFDYLHWRSQPPLR